MRGLQVKDYLAGLEVTVREYNDVWACLRLREWGDGKVRSILSLLNRTNLF